MKDLIIFESHCHFDDEVFDKDREEILHSLPALGINYCLNIAADPDSVESTNKLTKDYDIIYGALGIHPSYADKLDSDLLERIRALAYENKKVLAIGEIGLDYHYDEPDRDVQKQAFISQLKLARELGKPIVIHSRDACADTMEILKSPVALGIKGVMHCYSYSVEIARELNKLGFYFGIGGVITFKNARNLVETVEEIPLDHLLLETDCPYLAPTPHRGERNDSTYLPLIAEKIAAIKGIPYHQVINQTYKNARKLFMGK